MQSTSSEKCQVLHPVPHSANHVQCPPVLANLSQCHVGSEEAGLKRLPSSQRSHPAAKRYLYRKESTANLQSVKQAVNISVLLNSVASYFRTTEPARRHGGAKRHERRVRLAGIPDGGRWALLCILRRPYGLTQQHRSFLCYI